MWCWRGWGVCLCVCDCICCRLELAGGENVNFKTGGVFYFSWCWAELPSSENIKLLNSCVFQVVCGWGPFQLGWLCRCSLLRQHWLAREGLDLGLHEFFPDFSPPASSSQRHAAATHTSTYSTPSITKPQQHQTQIQPSSSLASCLTLGRRMWGQLL